MFKGSEDWSDVFKSCWKKQFFHFLLPQEEQGGVLPASDFLSGDPMGAEHPCGQQ